MGAEEIEAGAAEHLALEHLQVSDSALHGSGDAFECQAVGDGVQVAAYAGGEVAQCGEIVGLDGLKPGRELLAASAGHDGGEGADVLVEPVEVFAAGEPGS